MQYEYDAGEAAAMTRPSSLATKTVGNCTGENYFVPMICFFIWTTIPMTHRHISYYNQCNELYNSAKKTWNNGGRLSAFGQPAAGGLGLAMTVPNAVGRSEISYVEIMKKDCNIRFPFEHQTLRWHLLL